MDDHLRGKSELRSRKWRDGWEKASAGTTAGSSTVQRQFCSFPWRQSSHHDSSNGGGGCGGSPVTLVTIALAMSLSLTLLFWDAVRNIANARAWEHRSRAMITPIAWSITVREASEDRIWSVRAA